MQFTFQKREPQASIFEPLKALQVDVPVALELATDIPCTWRVQSPEA